MTNFIRLLAKFLAIGAAAASFTAATAAPLTGAISSVGTLCLGSTAATSVGSECVHQDASTLTYLDFIHGALQPGDMTATPGQAGSLLFLTALGDLMPLLGQIAMIHDFEIPGPGDPLGSFGGVDPLWHATGTDGAVYTYALDSLTFINRVNGHALDVRGVGTLCRDGTDCNLFSFLFTTQDADGGIRTTFSISQSGFGPGEQVDKVPEPGAISLIGLGLAGLALSLRRRRPQ